MTYEELKEKIAALNEEIAAKNMAKGVIHLQYAFELNLRYKDFFDKKVNVTLSDVTYGSKATGYFGGFDVVYSPSLEVRVIMYSEKNDGSKSKKRIYVHGTSLSDYDKLKIELA